MTAERVVSVVAVTYNSAADLPAYFEAIRRATPDGTALRVTVVDNDSGDGTVERVRELRPDAHVIRLPENRGYAAGINAALREWAGDGPVLVLNPDVRLRPGALGRCWALVQPGVGIAVPHIVNAEGRTQRSLRREPSVLRVLGPAVLGPLAGARPRCPRSSRDRHRYERPGTADWATGAAMLLGRACVRRSAPGTSRSSSTPRRPTSASAPATPATARHAPAADAVHPGWAASPSPGCGASSRSTGCGWRRRIAPVRGRLRRGCHLNEAVRAPVARPRAALRALFGPPPPPALRGGPDAGGGRRRLLLRPGLLVPQPGPLGRPAHARLARAAGCCW